MGSIARELEAKGIPTSAIIYKEHEGNYLSALSLKGYGYAYHVAIPADELQSVEGATKLAKENAQALLDGLVISKVPHLKREGNLLKPDPAVFTFRGKNAEAADAAFQKAFLDLGFGDGLPLVPPTKEKVDWMLTGTDRNPDEVIGTMGPSTGQVTIRNIAINAVMAGCRPEYLPVVIAAMEAITSQSYDWYAAQLRGVAPLVVVNGPIVRQIGVNYRNNNLGPNSDMPAGGPIGRAINLIWRNVGGFGAGLTPPAQHGQPGMFTGLVVGESEWDTFAKWQPLNQQIGFPKGSNTVTVIGVVGSQSLPSWNLNNLATSLPAPTTAWAGTMEAWKQKKLGVLLVTPFVAGRLGGYDKDFPTYQMRKEDLAKYLAENVTMSREKFVKVMAGGDESKAKGLAKELLAKYDKEIPLAYGPDSFLIVNSGGWCSCMPWSWLQADTFMNRPVAKLIKLPKNWDALLAAAK